VTVITCNGKILFAYYVRCYAWTWTWRTPRVFYKSRPCVSNCSMCQYVLLGIVLYIFQYLGEWYEVERYFAWFEFGGKCVTANYSLNEDSSMKIINKQISSLWVCTMRVHGVISIINGETARQRGGMTSSPYELAIVPSWLTFVFPYLEPEWHRVSRASADWSANPISLN
jgi:hypothetical protein